MMSMIILTPYCARYFYKAPEERRDISWQQVSMKHIVKKALEAIDHKWRDPQLLSGLHSSHWTDMKALSTWDMPSFATQVVRPSDGLESYAHIIILGLIARGAKLEPEGKHQLLSHPFLTLSYYHTYTWIHTLPEPWQPKTLALTSEY